MNYTEEIKQRIKQVILDNIGENFSRWEDNYHILLPDSDGWNKPKAGCFGKVYKAMDLDTFEVVAVKEIGLNFKTDYSNVRLSRQSSSVRGDSAAMFDFLMACQEYVLQSEIELAALMDFVNESSQLTERIRRNLRLVKDLKLYIVMEIYDENLEEAFSKEVALGRNCIKEIILGIAGALQFIHAKGYVHRDLKPRNILVADKFKVALGDFGLCKRVEEGERMGGTVGTPPYTTAPDETLTTSFDIWSLGVIAFELFYLSESEDRPSSGQMEQAMNKLIETARGGDTKKLKEFVGSKVKPKAMKNLIAECLQVQSQQRPCANDFFKMPCFKDLVVAQDGNLLPATVTVVVSETESEAEGNE